MSEHLASRNVGITFKPFDIERHMAARRRRLGAGSADASGLQYGERVVQANAMCNGHLNGDPMPAGTRPLILVIDPDASLRELIRDLFSLEGYAVVTESSIDPERLYEVSPAAVIYGLGFGDEADDVVSLRALVDERPDGCATVVCTADPAQIAAHAEALASLNIPIVSKPFDVGHLLGIVQDGLDDPAGSVRR